MSDETRARHRELERRAALVPPPCIHRHRCLGAPVQTTGIFGGDVDGLKLAVMESFP